MKNFLTLADLTPEELRGLLALAVRIKAQWKAGESEARSDRRAG